MRTLLFTLTLLVPAALGVALAQGCSSEGDGPADAAADREAGIELCDLDAFSGNGNACPFVSTRLCFKLCDNGGCRCTQGASGPVWKCVNDFSCYADASPLDDGGSGDAQPADAGVDASDAGAD